MKQYLIQLFAEHNNNIKDKYAILDDGSRITINENQIDKIWWEWVVRTDVRKRTENNYTIFEFSKPMLIEL